jgi:cell division protein FtsZ
VATGTRTTETAPRRRAGGFLDRFADTARRLLEGSDADQRSAADRAAPQVGAPRMPAATAAQTSSPATVARPAPNAELQPGAHASPRVQVPPAEEDVLDIPAFLRRQAN